MVQADRRLPLFGNFVLPAGYPDYYEIDLSHFSNLQISLMNYFSVRGYQSIILHVSLSLIFHWYHSQKHHPFMKLFSDEQVSWKEMIKLLTESFCLQSSFVNKKVVDSLSM
jgi:hypothetical protein